MVKEKTLCCICKKRVATQYPEADPDTNESYPICDNKTCEIDGIREANEARINWCSNDNLIKDWDY